MVKLPDDILVCILLWLSSSVKQQKNTCPFPNASYCHYCEEWFPETKQENFIVCPCDVLSVKEVTFRLLMMFKEQLNKQKEELLKKEPTHIVRKLDVLDKLYI